MISPVDSSSSFALMTGIVLSAFVSEDGAIVGAAALASTMALDLSAALFSAFFGLWISDFGVYAAVRIAREKLPADSRSARWIYRKLGLSEQNYPKRQEQLALALSRMVPGTRFPAYVAAGALRMPVATFAGITALTAALWTGLVFVAMHFFRFQASNVEEALVIATVGGLAVFALLTLWKLWAAAARKKLSR